MLPAVVLASEGAQNLQGLDALLTEPAVVQHRRASREIGIWQEGLHNINRMPSIRLTQTYRHREPVPAFLSRPCVDARMVGQVLHRVGLRSAHLELISLGSIALCLGLWIRAKTVDQQERGNAERRGLFTGSWPPTL